MIATGRVIGRDDVDLPPIGRTALYHVELHERLKGEAPEVLLIAVDANASREALLVDDEDGILGPGDEALFFLQYSDELQLYGILGLAGGLYPISAGAHGEHVIRGLHAPAATSVAAFSARVRALAANSPRASVR